MLAYKKQYCAIVDTNKASNEFPIIGKNTLTGESRCTKLREILAKEACTLGNESAFKQALTERSPLQRGIDADVIVYAGRTRNSVAAEAADLIRWMSFSAVFATKARI